MPASTCTRFALLLLLTITALSVAHASSAAGPDKLEMSIDELKDKIRGGWAGKMIGVAYGFPSEFGYLGKTNDDPIKWQPEQVADALDQDDLYVGMTLAETMDKLGLDATTQQYGEDFKHSKYVLWHANACARRNLQNGIEAPMSGHPKHNIHANDIDFQIEADFIGMMCPGMPQESNKYCDRVGHVMNHGDGVYGGMFIAGMYAAAYHETDPRKVVEAGLACLPADSQYARLIQDVLHLQQQHPDDWRVVWQRLEDKWAHDDCCIEGAMHPFNIDAKLNGGYVAMGLLYGQGNFDTTVEISTRLGQDSDCNPSTAAGILGVMIGYSQIPEKWKSGIPAVESKKFSHTNSSLNDICDSTLNRCQQITKRLGGDYSADTITIPIQQPEPAALEQWSIGVPIQRVAADSPRMTWKGAWEPHKNGRGNIHSTTQAGAEVTMKFEGTGVALSGEQRPYGGKFDVYLDGKKQATVDSYANKNCVDNGLWHTYDLPPGPHTLRIVVLGEKSNPSTGTAVEIAAVVVYE